MPQSASSQKLAEMEAQAAALRPMIEAEEALAVAKKQYYTRGKSKKHLQDLQDAKVALVTARQAYRKTIVPGIVLQVPQIDVASAELPVEVVDTPEPKKNFLQRWFGDEN